MLEYIYVHVIKTINVKRCILGNLNINFIFHIFYFRIILIRNSNLSKLLCILSNKTSLSAHVNSTHITNVTLVRLVTYV